MKTKRTLIQTCLLAALLALPVKGHAQFTFTTNSDAITITGYTGTNGAVSIPGATNGYPVTTIASLSGAFTNVSIPISVTNVGEACFTGCSNLTGITVALNNPAYYSAAGVLFAQNPPTLIAYPAALGGNYAIPGNVTGIGPWAFWRCYDLTSVTIPDSVTNMVDDAIGDFGGFFQCLNLTNVTLGNSVTNIGEGAFNGCSKLSSIAIPNSVTSIEASAFYDCYDLTNVTIGANVRSIGSDAFSYCRLAGVTLPNSVISIGDYAFEECPLTSVTIPNSVATIGASFAFCQGLTNVIIGTNLTTIGGSAFEHCILTSVTIPNSVTSIGDYAFSWCPLNSISIPNSVTGIGSCAFSNCVSLTNVMIGSGLASMGDDVFYGCGELNGIYFLGNAPAVQPDAFTEFFEVEPGSSTPNVISSPIPATAYYLAGTTGWGATIGGGEIWFNYNFSIYNTQLAGLPTALWAPPAPPVPPAVGISTYGQQPAVFFPTATGTNYVLQMTTNLASGNWVTVTNGTPISGIIVTNPPGSAFFRLH